MTPFFYQFGEMVTEESHADNADRIINTKERRVKPAVNSSLFVLNWPDSGLTRNTCCRCYRCSVPGLAGFTRLTLCGARSLITRCQLPVANCVPGSETFCLAQREMGNRRLANNHMAVFRCASSRSNPLMARCNNT